MGRLAGSIHRLARAIRLPQLRTGRLAAIEWDRGAGDEGGLIGAQPEDARGDVRCRADPAEWHALGGHLLSTITSRQQMISQDRTGCDHIDADPLVGVVKGSRLAESDDPSLAGYVRRKVARGTESRYRCHVDD